MLIKVCGMKDAANIKAVEELEIDMMGFIFYPPSKRYVTEIPAYLPQKIQRVGVFVNADIEFIQTKQREFKLDIIQLHGEESAAICQKIKTTTGCKIIKAISVHQNTDFENIYQYENNIDYFLFDTACESKGGSGKTFDHSLLQNYKGTTPFLLSGGLGTDNTQEIKQFEHPQFAGIDLNSKFEIKPGLKDANLLKEFIKQITLRN